MWMIQGSPRTPDRLLELSGSCVQQSEVFRTMIGALGHIIRVVLPQIRREWIRREHTMSQKGRDEWMTNGLLNLPSLI
jgi:hypothetical protein